MTSGIRTVSSIPKSLATTSVSNTSLITCFQIVDSIRNSHYESSVPHIVDQEHATIPADFLTVQRSPVTDDFYSYYVSVLQRCLTSCENFLPYLAGRGQDIRLVEQLKDYVRRLLGVKPAQRPQEQFNHLYALRKWLFYVPVVSLRSPGKDVVTLIVIAYYYAVALEMETLFPNVARAFCSGMSETPLREILDVFDQRLTHDPANESLQMQLTLLAFPKQAIAAYQGRKQEPSESQLPHASQDFEGFGEQLFTMESQGISAQRSPGFAPPGSRTASSASGSMYLEVPTLASDPSQEYSASELGLPMSMEPEELSFGDMSMELPGGFVHHPFSPIGAGPELRT